MNYDFSTIKYDRVSILLRGLYSLVISGVLVMVIPPILLLVAVELVLALIKGTRPPLALMRVTDRLVCYVYQLTDYLVLKESRLPFPFRSLPPPSAQFASQPEEPLSSSDYADAEDITITNAPSRETAPVCSLADSEDVTVANQVGYDAANIPDAVDASKSEQENGELAELDPEKFGLDPANLDLDLEKLGLDETEFQQEELDETVLSAAQSEPEQNNEPSSEIEEIVDADKNDSDEAIDDAVSERPGIESAGSA